jgi:hypothetical protein
MTRSLFNARHIAAAATILILAAPAASHAQDDSWDSEPTWSAPEGEPQQQQEDDSFVSIRGGLGLTGNPDTFLMSVELPFVLTELFSAGPQLRLGVSDDEVYFAPTLQGYVTPRLGGDLDAIRPYGSLGLGIAVLEKDGRRRGRDEDDVDFLLSPGFGIEYAIDETMFVGSGIQLDVIPAGVAGERFIFSWQILTFRAAF